MHLKPIITNFYFRYNLDFPTGTSISVFFNLLKLCNIFLSVLPPLFISLQSAAVFALWAFKLTKRREINSVKSSAIPEEVLTANDHRCKALYKGIRLLQKTLKVMNNLT